MLKIFNLQDKIELIKVKSDYFGEEYFAPRPKSEVLQNLKLKLRNLDQIRERDISLRDYLEKSWSHIVIEKMK